MLRWIRRKTAHPPMYPAELSEDMVRRSRALTERVRHDQEGLTYLELQLRLLQQAAAKDVSQ